MISTPFTPSPHARPVFGVQLCDVQTMLVSVTDMQRCIERKKQGIAGGFPTVVPLSLPGTVDTTAAHIEVGAGRKEGAGTVLSLRQALHERHPLAYPLLRWLLSA